MSDEVVNFPYCDAILDIYTAVPVKNSQVYPRSILSKILGNTCCKSKKPVVKKLQRKDVLITSAERRQEIKEKQRERDEKAKKKVENAKKKAEREKCKNEQPKVKKSNKPPEDTDFSSTKCKCIKQVMFINSYMYIGACTVQTAAN